MFQTYLKEMKKLQTGMKTDSLWLVETLYDWMINSNLMSKGSLAPECNWLFMLWIALPNTPYCWEFNFMQLKSITICIKLIVNNRFG